MARKLLLCQDGPPAAVTPVTLSQGLIFVNPKNTEELQFISELLQKLEVDAKVLSDEDTEDVGLAIVMKDVDRSDVASEDEVMEN